MLDLQILYKHKKPTDVKSKQARRAVLPDYAIEKSIALQQPEVIF